MQHHCNPPSKAALLILCLQGGVRDRVSFWCDRAANQAYCCAGGAGLQGRVAAGSPLVQYSENASVYQPRSRFAAEAAAPDQQEREPEQAGAVAVPALEPAGEGSIMAAPAGQAAAEGVAGWLPLAEKGASAPAIMTTHSWPELVREVQQLPGPVGGALVPSLSVRLTQLVEQDASACPVNIAEHQKSRTPKIRQHPLAALQPPSAWELMSWPFAEAANEMLQEGSMAGGQASTLTQKVTFTVSPVTPVHSLCCNLRGAVVALQEDLCCTVASLPYLHKQIFDEKVDATQALDTLVGLRAESAEQGGYKYTHRSTGYIFEIRPAEGHATPEHELLLPGQQELLFIPIDLGHAAQV